MLVFQMCLILTIDELPIFNMMSRIINYKYKKTIKMKKNYSTPEMEIMSVMVANILATSPGGKEEISQGGPTDEIEEIKESIWE